MYNYKHYEKLLMKLAHKGAKYLNETFDDMLGEAALTFVKATKSYKEDSTISFCTYLTYKVRDRYRTMYNDKQTEKNKHKRYMSSNKKKQALHNDNYFSLIAMSELSREAHIVATLVLNPPIDLMKLNKYFGTEDKKLGLKVTKTMIQEYVQKEYRWTQETTKLVFNELRQFV